MLCRIVERRDRFAAGFFHERMIAKQVADPQCRQAGLPRAEEVAWSAKREVALRDLEAVCGIGQRLQALAPLLGERLLVEQHAERLVGATADASTQLVELGETEPFRVF